MPDVRDAENPVLTILLTDTKAAGLSVFRARRPPVSPQLGGINIKPYRSGLKKRMGDARSHLAPRKRGVLSTLA
jgi:hypothetical protein